MNQWASVSDFFAMGGYGLYVWGAYGVCAAALVLELIWATRRHHLALERARSLSRVGINKPQGYSS